MARRRLASAIRAGATAVWGRSVAGGSDRPWACSGDAARWMFAFGWLGLAPITPAHGQDDAADLAKQLANPIASLVSVPFQFNYDHDIGSADGDRLLLNVQPVVPFDFTEDWNVISRTILPIVGQSDVVGGDDQFGLGNTVQSLFFSPKEAANGVIWGAGPVFYLPTATDDALGPSKFGLGPTGVALVQSGPWTYGALANHVWSVAGDDGDPDVNATFLQPFLNYTTAGATTFFLNTEATYDWDADEIAVPLNAGVNQLVTLGGQRIQLGAGLRWWAASPDTGPEGLGARVNLVFLFPK